MHILQEWLVDEVKRGGHWAKLPKRLRKRFQYTGPVYCGEREEDLPMPDRKASDYTLAELITKYESKYTNFKVNRDTASEFWRDNIESCLHLCCEIIKWTKFTPMDDQQQHYGDISGPNLESNCKHKWQWIINDINRAVRLCAACREFDEQHGVSHEIKSRTFALRKSYPTLASSAGTIAEAAFKIIDELHNLVESCCLENSFRSLLSLSIQLADKPHDMSEIWAADLEVESMFVDGLLPEPEPDSVVVRDKTENKTLPDKAKPEATWQSIAAGMLAMKKRGIPFTKQAGYEVSHGWKQATVSKAINRTPELWGWAGKHKTKRAKGADQLNDMTLDKTPQSREGRPDGCITSEDIEAMISDIKEAAADKPELLAMYNAYPKKKMREMAITAIKSGLELRR